MQCFKLVLLGEEGGEINIKGGREREKKNSASIVYHGNAIFWVRELVLVMPPPPQTHALKSANDSLTYRKGGNIKNDLIFSPQARRAVTLMMVLRPVLRKKMTMSRMMTRMLMRMEYKNHLRPHLCH